MKLLQPKHFTWQFSNLAALLEWRLGKASPLPRSEFPLIADALLEVIYYCSNWRLNCLPLPVFSLPSPSWPVANDINHRDYEGKWECLNLLELFHWSCCWGERNPMGILENLQEDAMDWLKDRELTTVISLCLERNVLNSSLESQVKTKRL